MKIQCDVCEKAPATMICCADEAALCAKCDVEVHAANKLASKHQRLVLDSLANKLPRCDICQEKTAFIFCVEDRALFCKDCDEPIHSAGNLAANHQRFLATGIRVALSSSCNNEAEKSCFEPPNQSSSSQQQVPVKLPPAQPQQQQSSFGSPWGVDDLLRFPEFGSPADKKEQMQMGEFEWLAEMGIFGDQFTDEALAAAEVPQLPASPPPPPPTNFGSYKPAKSGMPHKKQRIEIVEEDDEYFMVPDIG